MVGTTPVAHRLPDPPRRPKRCGSGHERGDDPVVPQELAVDAARVFGDGDVSDDAFVIVGDEDERVI